MLVSAGIPGGFGIAGLVLRLPIRPVLGAVAGLRIVWLLKCRVPCPPVGAAVGRGAFTLGWVGVVVGARIPRLLG